MASLSAVEAPRFTRDRLTWLAYISLSTYAFYIYALGPVVAFLHQELHLTYTLTSLHSTLWSVGSVLAGLTLQPLARRLGRQRLFWLAAATTGVGALLFIVGHAVAVTLLAALVLGTGSTLVGAVSSVVLADRHGRHSDRALVEANLGASGVGTFVPALLGLLALTAGGWRSALLLPLVALGVLFLVLGRVPMPAPPIAASAAAGACPGVSGPTSCWWPSPSGSSSASSSSPSRCSAPAPGSPPPTPRRPSASSWPGSWADGRRGPGSPAVRGARRGSSAPPWGSPWPASWRSGWSA